MADSTNRLEIEQQNLLAFAEHCANLEVHAEDPAKREYKISLAVQSISDFDSAANTLENCDCQEIELTLPLSYPKDPPQMRWLTPIFHPNVSLSGYLDTQDIGLEWAEDMSLLVVVERLWDISRFAWVDVESANNYSAKRKWNEGLFQVPTDPKPMKDDVSVKLANVISYQPLQSSGIPVRAELVQNVERDESVYSIEDSGSGKPKETESIETAAESPVAKPASPVASDDDPVANSESAKVDQASTNETDSEIIDDSDVLIISDDDQGQRPPRVKSGDDDIFVIE